MTAHDDLDRQLNDLLRDGPEELPYQSFDAVRDRTELTRQRVVIGPWRLPEMNKIVTIGLGAAAVVLAVVVGAQLFGSPGSGTGGPGGDPSATAEPTVTPEPTSTPEAALSPTQRFTSPMHGISLSYPEGWTAQPATESWTTPTFPLDVEGADIDVLFDPNLGLGDLFLAIASQPIGDSTPEDWLAEQMASEEGCAETEPVTVDDASGLTGVDNCTVVVVSTANRGYWIQLYTGREAPRAYDQTWFDEVLGTVQLHPEDAVDAAASPSP
jgi:hypothetical protein